jgi:Cytoskeletal adhesion
MQDVDSSFIEQSIALSILVSGVSELKSGFVDRQRPLTIGVNNALVCILADSNVVVEIKHWKSKEKKFSVLAWSFLPAHVLISRTNAGSNGALTTHYCTPTVHVYVTRTSCDLMHDT